MPASAGGSPMSRSRSSEEQPPVSVAKANAELSARIRDAFNMAMTLTRRGRSRCCGMGLRQRFAARRGVVAATLTRPGPTMVA